MTGATGHIGSYIVRDLAYKIPSVEIVMLDKNIVEKYLLLLDLPSTCDYTFHDVDILSGNLCPLFDNVNIVIHLAAITDATSSFENQDEIISKNTEATSKIAEACINSGSRMIALSTTSVYGTIKDRVSEDCSFEDINPQSPYALSKIKEEEISNTLCLNKGLKAVICRFGTIFGISPSMKYHTAVNKFCRQAVSGESITVWSTALDQKRPYLDIVDASNIISFIINNDLFDGRIYNASTITSTVRHIIDTIREFVPNIDMKFVDEKIMNKWSYGVSCERLINSGFTFTGDLHRGIGDTIALLRSSNHKIE